MVVINMYVCKYARVTQCWLLMLYNLLKCYTLLHVAVLYKLITSGLRIYVQNNISR